MRISYDPACVKYRTLQDRQCSGRTACGSPLVGAPAANALPQAKTQARASCYAPGQRLVSTALDDLEIPNLDAAAAKMAARQGFSACMHDAAISNRAHQFLPTPTGRHTTLA